MVDRGHPQDPAAEEGPAPQADEAPHPGAQAPAQARTDPALQLPVLAATDGAGAHETKNTPGAAADDDPAMRRYLASVDLDGLDLSDIALEPPPGPSAVALVAATATVGAAAVGLVFLPNTALYQLHSGGEMLLCLLAAGGALAVRSVVRHLGAWPALVATARRLGAQVPQGQLPQGAARPLVLAAAAAIRIVARRPRTALAVAIAGLFGAMALLLPHEAEWAGGTYSTGWFLAVLVAMTCGILVGRLILVQAEATPLPGGLRPIVLPSYVRWLSLGLLVGGGLLASFGHAWFGWGSPGTGGEFALSGLSLAVGVFGAIWLARRFDEWEAGWRRRPSQPAAAPRARPQTDVGPRGPDDEADFWPRPTGSTGHKEGSWDLGETGQNGKKP